MNDFILTFIGIIIHVSAINYISRISPTGLVRQNVKCCNEESFSSIHSYSIFVLRSVQTSLNELDKNLWVTIFPYKYKCILQFKHNTNYMLLSPEWPSYNGAGLTYFLGQPGS